MVEWMSDTSTAAPEPDASASTLDTSWQLPRAAWWLVAVGVALRVVWAFVAARQPKILADPMTYLTAAQRIADGQGYVGFYGFPTSYFPPGYPWFIGIYQWFLELVGLGDHQVIAVALLQSLLSGAAIAATFLIGRSIGGQRVGLVAAGILALWPNLILHSSLALSETLFITLLTVSLAGLLSMFDDGRWIWWRAALGGLCMGAATMVRPQVLLIAGAVVLIWALARPGWAELAKRCAVLGIGVLVFVGPWTVRNMVVLDGFVPVSTNDGDNLCVGFNPEATGHFGVPDSCDTGEFYIDGPDAELRRQKETRQRAIDWVLDNPGEQPGLAWKKLWFTFRSDDDAIWASMSFGQDPWMSQPLRTTLFGLSGSFYAAVMLFAAGGLVLASRVGWRVRAANPAPLIVVAGAVISSLLPIMFFGDARFKVPGAPFYALLAAVAMVGAVDWIRRRNDRAAADD